MKINFTKRHRNRLGISTQSGQVAIVNEGRQNGFDLENAKIFAEKSFQEINTYISNLTNELKTPVNNIMELAYELQKFTLNHEQLTIVNKIKSISENLLSRVNYHQKTEIAKEEAAPTAPGPFSIRETLKNVYDAAKYSAEKKDIDLNLYLEQWLPEEAVGNQMQFQAIFLSILECAIRYTPKGEICIFAKMVAENSSKSTIRFTIKGWETEISDDLKNQLLSNEEHLADLDPMETARLQQLLDILGSTLVIRNNRGGGAEFTFSVDFKKKSRILLADANDMLRKSLAFFLESKGYIVDQFENGKDAMRSIEEKDYALILTDINMPGISGLELTRTVRETLSLDVPIVIFTSSNVEQTQLDSFSFGADDFISKPISPSILNLRITRILENLHAKK